MQQASKPKTSAKTMHAALIITLPILLTAIICAGIKLHRSRRAARLRTHMLLCDPAQCIRFFRSGRAQHPCIVPPADQDVPQRHVIVSSLSVSEREALRSIESQRQNTVTCSPSRAAHIPEPAARPAPSQP